jgi:hypothetical protein
MGVWSLVLVQMARDMSMLPVNDAKNVSRIRINKRKHCSVTSVNLANAKHFTDKLFSCQKEQLKVHPEKRKSKVIRFLSE